MRTTGRRVPGRPLTSCMLAGAVALSVAACGGSSHQSGGGGSSGGSRPGPSASAGNGGPIYGTLPKLGGTPVKGGTLTYGQLSGSTPTVIFPIIPAADASVYTSYPFIYQMFLPLYNGPNGATPQIDNQVSIAHLPVYSDGGRTVTINLKRGYRWSDGKPVDANDVVFDIDLIKAAVRESAANELAYTPGLFPDNVTSISTYYPTQNSLFNTTGAYNQGAYSSSRANSLINASVHSSNPNAVRNEAAFLTKDVPALFMPNSDLIYAVSNTVHAASAGSFLALTQYQPFGQYFWLSK